MAATFAPNRPATAVAPDLEHPSSTFAEREAVLARVMLETHDRFRREGVSEEALNRFAKEAVDTLWAERPRVTSYVPILALRIVRDKVRSAVNSPPEDARESA